MQKVLKHRNYIPDMKIYVKVKPNSLESRILSNVGDKFVIELKSPPEKNKANLELIKILSKHLGIPPQSIIIKAGLTAKEKIIEVKNEIRKS